LTENDRIEQLESRISELENRLSKLEDDFASPTSKVIRDIERSLATVIKRQQRARGGR